LDSTVSIQRVVEEPSFSATGQSQPIIRVEFKVGSHGPFVERFVKSEFNSGAVNAKLQQFAQQLGGLAGS